MKTFIIFISLLTSTSYSFSQKVDPDSLYGKVKSITEARYELAIFPQLTLTAPDRTKTLYDNNGKKVEEQFLKSDNSVKSKICYKYNSANKETDEITYDADGTIESGSYSRYNDLGNLIESGRYFGNKEPHNRYLNYYDKHGHIAMSRDVYDKERNKQYNYDEKTIFKCDKKGRTVYEAEYGFNRDSTVPNNEYFYKYRKHSYRMVRYCLNQKRKEPPYEEITETINKKRNVVCKRYCRNGNCETSYFNFDKSRRQISENVYNDSGRLELWASFKYNDAGRPIEDLVYHDSALVTHRIYRYDDAGHLTERWFYEDNEGKLQLRSVELYWDFDLNGNWLMYVYSNGSTPTIIEKREITYH